MIFGPDRRAGEMWTYGPPGKPSLYERKEEAQTVGLSLCDILQQEVGIYLEGNPYKMISVIGFKEKGCPPELKPSSR